jgi:predicted signal transduction protein with EAL and GGDEF domain
VLWNAVPAPTLLIWSGLLIAVTGARFLTLRAYRNAAPKPESEHVVWTRYFLAGACAAGVVWGASGILLFHPSSFPHQVLLAFVLGGMVAGAVPLLSSVNHAFRCFAIPAVVPISIRMMWVGDQIHLVMGLMIAIFGLAMLATSAQVQRLFRDSEKLRRELFSSTEVAQALEYLVRLDSLTGIPNRRLFEEELGKEWARATREHAPLSLIMADIDHFKEYNDHYGHPAGGMCLVEVCAGHAPRAVPPWRCGGANRRRRVCVPAAANGFERRDIRGGADTRACPVLELSPRSIARGQAGHPEFRRLFVRACFRLLACRSDPRIGRGAI